MVMTEHQELHAQLLDMLGAKDHEDAARIIALHHVRETAQRSTEPTAYFAADPANGEFITQDTLDAAIASAQWFLTSAQDDAADYGWPDEPPQICYGVLLGGCVELEGSRKPAPEGSDYDEVIDFRLEPYTATPTPAGVPDGWQLIDTAPKSTADGTRVNGIYLLGFVPDPEEDFDRQALIDIIWWEPLLRNPRGGRGTWRRSAGGEDVDVEPTHWMPLPTAPEAKPHG